MLRISPDKKSIDITLQGMPQADGLVVWVSVVIIGLIVFLWTTFIEKSAQLSLGGLAIFAITCFIFHEKHRKIKAKKTHICHGVVHLSAYQLIYAGEQINFDNTMHTTIKDNTLTISDSTKTYHLSHFEHTKEAIIAQLILTGKALNTRNAKIQMTSQIQDNT